MTFNRTAYGIETRDAVHIRLDALDAFNRTAYGIETELAHLSLTLLDDF